MIRVLYIARYTKSSMDRKVELTGRPGEVEILLIRPARDGDLQHADRGQGYLSKPVSMIGEPDDPHRALYGTLTFSMADFKPDIIHAEEEPDSLAALQIATAKSLFAPKSLLVLHTWQNVNRRKSALVRWVMKQTLHRADAVLCANSQGLTILEQLGYGGHKELIPPQGVDTRVFHPRQYPTNPVFTVVYAGRLVPEKGLDLLIGAMAMMSREYRLLIAGEGPERENLERQAKVLGGVEFLGSLDEQLLSEVLCRADVLVLPSRGKPAWKEQFGRVLVEAMASGIPVIGSSSGAIPEVIGDAGLVFEEDNSHSLAECLNRLAQSPGLRKELGQKGLARVRHLYSQEAVAAQTVDFYHRIMELKRAC